MFGSLGSINKQYTKRLNITEKLRNSQGTTLATIYLLYNQIRTVPASGHGTHF